MSHFLETAKATVVNATLTAVKTRTPAEIWAESNPVDVCFIMICVALCWPIIPAVGMAYAGYSTRRNGLASFLPSMLTMGCVSIQWWAWGYTLAYGEGNAFIGDLKYIFHQGVLAEPVGTIPMLLFSEFQLVFCATVCAIVVGGAAERGRLLPIIPFIFLWSTFVYTPLAHMVWADNGFLAVLGALDFAGGTPVHICSGASATAYSVYLSRPLFRSRKSSTRTPGHLVLHRPHNSMSQLIALIIIWGGWLAFDAGTTLALNFRSVNAMSVTNICASAGAMTWACMTYYESGRWSLDSTFMGALAGLVFITPAAGFIDMTTAFFFGVIGAVVCRQALRFKFTKLAERMRWVDNADTFATHCVGGFVATILTGIFAKKDVAFYDGATEIIGGAVFDGHWGQVGIQIVEALIGLSWSFVVTYLIVAAIDFVPGFEVLAVDKAIVQGMEKAECGEEGLWENSWDGEEDYHPFHKQPVLLE